MTWRDKMEIGLKDDARFRRDNLPDFEVEGPQVPAGPKRSPIVPAAVTEAAAESEAIKLRRRRRASASPSPSNSTKTRKTARTHS